MSGLLGNPKVLAILIITGIVFLTSLAGGALGNAFGFGFLSTPIASIQIPAEPFLPGELFPGFTLMNTMVTAWLSIIVLAVISYLATRNLSEVPRGMQNLLEVFIEFFLNLAESIAGKERARRFFPLVMTIFLYIMISNWMGILPGYGTIGWIEPAEEVIHHQEELAEDDGGHANLEEINLHVFEGDGGFVYLAPGSLDQQITAEQFEHDQGAGDGKTAGLLIPFLRSANTDVNTTLAIALVAMVMVHFWGFSTLGFLGHIGKFINFKEGPIGFFVGILEAISELARIISFTFRLFGNIFAGEVLLVAMAFLLPLIGIIPFLGLELFVGVIQAFIFAMLTLVFAVMATTSHGGEDHH
ncbi:MAG: F0F1 ATP synthase subunit A [Chloroflexi bacterium]|nr:F0F1 ATP synthase subunit A [Chloroflexota bacterium]